MKTSKLLIASLAGGVTFFILGWLVYGMLLTDFMSKQNYATVMRAEADTIWWAAILSNLVMGFLLAWVLGKWGGIRTLMGGLIGGAILGALIAGTVDFGMYAWTNLMDITAIILDIVAYTVMGALTGGVVGWVLGTIKD